MSDDQHDQHDQPDLLDALVHALRATTDRELTVDEGLRTFHVRTDLDATVFAIPRPDDDAVTFYAVRPGTVPAARTGAVAELAVRANADLFDATLELDPDRGTLAVRASVRFAGLAIPTAELGALLADALDVVEDVADRFADAVDAVVAGTVDPAAAVARVRQDRLAAARDELASLEAEVTSLLRPPSS